MSHSEAIGLYLTDLSKEGEEFDFKVGLWNNQLLEAVGGKLLENQATERLAMATRAGELVEDSHERRIHETRKTFRDLEFE